MTRKQDKAQADRAQVEALAFAHTIGHDFNNVLTVINGNLRLLLKRLEAMLPDPQADELLKRLYPIDRAAQRGEALVKQLAAVIETIETSSADIVPLSSVPTTSHHPKRDTG